MDKRFEKRTALGKEPNIYTYIKQIGGVRFPGSDFFDIDALVFCQVGYVHYNDLFPDLYTEKTFQQISDEINSSKENYMKYMDVGVMYYDISYTFIDAAKTTRFKDVKITHFTKKDSRGDEISTQEQFAALTYILDDDRICVVFRGSDDSVVAWQEDCNLCLTREIPAQKHALEYLKHVLDDFPNHQVYVAGHSKGGNLAMYACANLPSEKRDRILKIYTFDSPGFPKDTLDSPNFLSIRPKMKTFYPHQSFVGMLFYHWPEYTVVESSTHLLLQHELSSWHTDPNNGTTFLTKEKINDECIYFYNRFNTFLDKCTYEQRKEFIDSIFEIMATADITNIADMFGNPQIAKIENRYDEVDNLTAIKNSSKRYAVTPFSFYKTSVASVKITLDKVKNPEARKLLLEVCENFVDAATNDAISKTKKVAKKGFKWTNVLALKAKKATNKAKTFILSENGQCFLLGIFFGLLGIHCFPKGKIFSGLSHLLISFISLAICWIPIVNLASLLLVIINSIWVGVELTLLVQDYKNTPVK